VYHSIAGNDQALPYNEIWTAPRAAATSSGGGGHGGEVPTPEEAIAVGIFMLYTDDISNYTVHSASMNAAYAARHHYQFMLSRAKLAQSSQDDGDGARSKQWDHAVTKLPQSKMKFLLDALAKLPETTGWLLWLDSDLAVLRQDVSLESILAAHAVGPDTNLLVSLEFTDAVADYEHSQGGGSNGEAGAEVGVEAGVEANSRVHNVNTGALMLRNCAWTRAMLLAWHSVGYATGERWTNDASQLTPWGRGFMEAAGKLPPDQQMHMELQRPGTLRDGGHGGAKLEYLKHSKLLPTTALNSRWPYWALDGYEEQLQEAGGHGDGKSASGGEPATHKPPELQFALHMFATTSEERVAVLGSLHRRALCPQSVPGGRSLPVAVGWPETEGDIEDLLPQLPPLWRLPPLTLAASMAADGMAALAARAQQQPAMSFPHAELCAAVYTLAQGAFAASPVDLITPAAHGRMAGGSTAGDAVAAEDGADSVLQAPTPRQYHPVYGLSQRHQQCLEPGMSAQVARGQVVRKNVDTAFFAYDVAVAVSQKYLRTQQQQQQQQQQRPRPPSQEEAPPVSEQVAQVVARLTEGLAEWTAQRDGLAAFRRGAGTFFAAHPAPAHVAALAVQVGRRAAPRYPPPGNHPGPVAGRSNSNSR
jgi:hypothetical protein